MIGPLLAAGREADVYALDEQRVLRRYRRDADVTGEAEVMRCLARRGYPVPAVYDAGRRDLVLERLDGPTMAEAMTITTPQPGAVAATPQPDSDATTPQPDDGARAPRADDGAAALRPDEATALLAGLLRRLHALSPWPGAPVGVALLHLDLHPENVLMTTRGPVVIDWCNARPGPPDLDTGLTALILAQVAVDPEHGWSSVALGLVPAFLRVAPGDPVRLLDDVVRFRRRQLGACTPAELALIGTAAEKVRACAR